MKQVYQSKPIQYPRRVVIRNALNLLTRMLLKASTRLEIIGRENIPLTGPVILAGNHVGVIEPVIMAAFSPRLVEFLGTGDIPLDPLYAWIVKVYGLIPVNRGNLDRKAFSMSNQVLSSGGCLGIFPEGGIWDPSHMQAQLGIAVLSHRTQTPIVPIGFGGMQGAFSIITRLKRPKLVMNIGRLLPPVHLKPGENQREGLQYAADEILAAIAALIPDEERRQYQNEITITYSLELAVNNGQATHQLPITLDESHGIAFARLLFTPVLLDTLLRNLKLPIMPLKHLSPVENLPAFQESLTAIIHYLEVNPGFFTYRFGMDEGLSLQKALNELRSLSIWVAENNYELTLVPRMSWVDFPSGKLKTKIGGDFPHSFG